MIKRGAAIADKQMSVEAPTLLRSQSHSHSSTSVYSMVKHSSIQPLVALNASNVKMDRDVQEELSQGPTLAESAAYPTSSDVIIGAVLTITRASIDVLLEKWHAYRGRIRAIAA